MCGGGNSKVPPMPINLWTHLQDMQWERATNNDWILWMKWIERINHQNQLFPNKPINRSAVVVCNYHSDSLFELWAQGVRVNRYNLPRVWLNEWNWEDDINWAGDEGSFGNIVTSPGEDACETFRHLISASNYHYYPCSMLLLLQDKTVIRWPKRQGNVIYLTMVKKYYSI